MNAIHSGLTRAGGMNHRVWSGPFALPGLSLVLLRRGVAAIRLAMQHHRDARDEALRGRTRRRYQRAQSIFDGGAPLFEPRRDDIFARAGAGEAKEGGTTVRREHGAARSVRPSVVRDRGRRTLSR